MSPAERVLHRPDHVALPPRVAHVQADEEVVVEPGDVAVVVEVTQQDDVLRVGLLRRELSVGKERQFHARRGLDRLLDRPGRLAPGRRVGVADHRSRFAGRNEDGVESQRPELCRVQREAGEKCRVRSERVDGRGGRERGESHQDQREHT